MKQTEAPEKIYITNFDIEALPKDEQLSEHWHEVSTQDTDIEYTRTDAFIEKACEYLQNTKRCVVECIGENVYKPLLSYEEIMEFCKSMKGE